MSELNVRLKDMAGNILYPTTNASIVKNNQGENLGDVEAGAQVNVIESVKINGSSGTLDGKELSFEIDALAEYNLEKLSTPEAGFVATYQLTKDGTGVGDKINIPKDLVVESGEVKTCTEADVPVPGYKVGDVYIDITLANADNQHIYIKATDLVDVYTAGNGLTLNDHEFSINTADTNVVDVNPTANSTKLVQSGGVKSAIDTAKSAAINESETYADTKDTALKQDVLRHLWSNANSFDSGYFNTKYTASNGSFALMFNENDGGGSQVYDKTDDVVSYVGTNLEEGKSADDDAVNVQIYSKDKTTNVGSRLNVSTKGIYYTSGKTNGAYTENDEVATKGDIAAFDTVADRQAADTALKQEVLGHIWSNNTTFDQGYFQTKYSHNSGSYAQLWNESDGGGSLVLDKTANVKSYVGTNLEEGNGDKASAVNVQLYSIDDTTKTGVRVNVNTEKAYYVKGAKGQGNPEGREIAVQDDIAAVSQDIADNYYDKDTANTIFLTYEILS